MNKFLKLLLGTTLYVLDQSDKSTRKVRDRAADNFDDLREMARDKYETASERVSRASDALMGEDHHLLSNLLSLAAGVGIGIGIGVMIAPASGEETRGAIADKVQVLGDKVKNKFSSESENYPSTGTNG
ncbi:MAG: YtxH domain-containing protein [Terriglobales bacterium]